MKEKEDLLKHLQPEDIDKLFKLSQLLTGNSSLQLQNRITILDLHNEITAYAEHNFSVKHATGISLSFKHLMKHFSPKREITNISRYDVEKFIMKLKQKVPEGYRNYFRNLRAAFNKAIDWGYLRENPFAKIKLPKKQRVRPAYLVIDELKKVCEFIDLEIVRDFVTVAFYTGMRLNEIVHLTWDCVNLNERTITIGSKDFTTKTRKQGTIPFGDEVFEILSKRIGMVRTHPGTKSATSRNKFGTGSLKRGLVCYVFAKRNGEHFTGDFFSKRFKRACREAGMPEAIHFHSLRASCACNLINKGVSIYLVKELLRHSSTAVTEIYSTAELSSLREAISKL